MQRIRPLLLVILLAALASCSTRRIVRTQVVEIPRYIHDSIVYIQRDTILQRDSVIVEVRGDTVRVRERSERTHTSNTDNTQRRSDSIAPPPLPSTVTIEEEEKQKNNNTNAWIFLLAGAAIPVAAWVGSKLKKK